MSEYVGEGTTYELQWFNKARCAWKVVDSYHTNSAKDDKYDALSECGRLTRQGGEYRVVEVSRKVVND